MDPVEPTPAPRLPDGRFSAGNAGGPGRPKGQRQTALQKAAQDAVTPEHMVAMMRRAMRMALEGNLQAMRFVAERVCGRPPEASPAANALDLEPPRLRTAGDCTAAVQKLTDAICQGTVDIMHGKVLLDAIATQAKLIDVGDLETRLAELEKQAQAVDLGGERR